MMADGGWRMADDVALRPVKRAADGCQTSQRLAAGLSTLSSPMQWASVASDMARSPMSWTKRKRKGRENQAGSQTLSRLATIARPLRGRNPSCGLVAFSLVELLVV